MGNAMRRVIQTGGRVGLVLGAALLISCRGGPGPGVTPDEDVVEQWDDELHVVDTRVGTGATATVGSTITVHYRGTLVDGTVFDSSLTREPLTFQLGARRVIRGWDQGLAGMKVGGKRNLVIPPRLAYGSKERGRIPANSHLIFDVELLQVE
jgi:FKBP-type peptidyl-prolyl cis-trans isomerase